MRCIDKGKFRDSIYYLIQDLPYKNEEVASYLGVSVQAMNKWTNGKSMPTVDKMVLLTALAHCKLDDFIPTCEVSWEGTSEKGRRVEAEYRKEYGLDRENREDER